MGRADETLRHRLVEERKQRIEVALYIQQADRLAVHAELGPRQDLAKFIQRAESPR